MSNNRKWSKYNNRWVVENDGYDTNDREMEVSIGTIIVASGIMLVAILIFVILITTIE